MANPLNIFCRPSLTALQKDELYQVRREVAGLEDKVFRLTIALRQAEATLDCTKDRERTLDLQVNPYTAEPELSIPVTVNRVTITGTGGSGGSKADL